MKVRVRVTAEEYGSGNEKISHTHIVYVDSPLTVVQTLRDELRGMPATAHDPDAHDQNGPKD